jgi:hypothetical protein
MKGNSILNMDISVDKKKKNVKKFYIKLQYDLLSQEYNNYVKELKH